jgi:hypothetical protein
VHGVDIVDYVVTEEPIGTRCTRHASGEYTGQIDNPDILLSAARQLVSAGATALAVTTNGAVLAIRRGLSLESVGRPLASLGADLRAGGVGQRDRSVE